MTGAVLAQRDGPIYNPDDLAEHMAPDRILAAEVQVEKSWKHKGRYYTAEVWERYLWQGWGWSNAEKTAGRPGS